MLIIISTALKGKRGVGKMAQSVECMRAGVHSIATILKSDIHQYNCNSEEAKTESALGLASHPV